MLWISLGLPPFQIQAYASACACSMVTPHIDRQEQFCLQPLWGSLLQSSVAKTPLWPFFSSSEWSFAAWPETSDSPEARAGPSGASWDSLVFEPESDKDLHSQGLGYSFCCWPRVPGCGHLWLPKARKMGRSLRGIAAEGLQQ